MATQGRSHERLVVLIGIVVISIIIVGAVAFNFANRPNIFRNPFRPESIPVSGTVTTTGFGTSPQRVDFRSSGNGQLYSAPVTVDGTGNYARFGSYSITLPNDSFYNATVTWTGLFGARGSCYVGSLSISQSDSSSREFDVTC